jgi:HK97 family phage prohead protease/HK97 family phage major capsid protein
MDKIMDKVLYLNSTFTTKSADTEDESIFIEGYANTTDIDRSGDVILSAAWSAGIENYLKNPIFLAYHDHDHPIGRLDEYKIDAKGLWVRAKISPAAGDVYKLIKDGVLTAFSVGFRVKDASYDPLNDIFFIKEVELMEISVVSVPCNQESLFSLAKAFDSEVEFNSFKSQYVSEATLDKDQEAKDLSNNKKGILDMDPKELQAMLDKAATDAVAKSDEARSKAVAEKAAKDAAEADISARIKEAVATQVSVGQSGAEKLLADIEAKFEAQTAASKSVLEGLEATIKEKAAELDSITKSKMKFGEKKDEGAVTAKEKETAVFLKTIMGRTNVQDTKFGASMIEKAGAHVPGAVPWEQEVSFNMENEIRQKLIVQSLLKQIAMQTNVMKIPLNPATGLGTWVTNAQFGTTASTGAAVTHQLAEITLSAYKVATLEYLAYEEEEDSLLILLPIIRDAMIRRVSRSVDQAFLRGAGAGADPVKGLATYATANTTNPVGTKVTVAQLRAMRKDLGIMGLDPSEVTYVVSSDVYYDLLDDAVFQTMNQVGTQATLLTGQIGQIGNSPVVVSGEFAAKGVGAIGAIAVNTANFIAGNQRGLRFDTQMMAETQRMVLVSSLRTGLTQLTANQGMGVTKLTWAA